MSRVILSTNKIGGITPTPHPSTEALKTPPTKFIANNPINGSVQNVLNSLSFFFPAQSSQAALSAGAIYGFAANDARSGIGYNPDNPEVFEISKSFGNILNNPQYGTLELGNTDPHIATGNDYTGIDNKKYTFQNIVFGIAIVEATPVKNIVKTKITGRDGEITEYINMGNWKVTIRSVVDMPADQAPLDFLQAFLLMLKAAVSIPVKNYYLNTLGITHLIIEDAPLIQQEGGYSSQAVTINCCSDIPLTEFLP